MDRSYRIETYGCQMNSAESGYIEERLLEGGWSAANEDECPRLVIINSCSVRKSAESRVWGRLGYYKAQKKRYPLLLGLMGCMVERLRDKIRREIPEVDFLIGNYGKLEFAQAIKEDLLSGKQDFFGNEEYVFATSHIGNSTEYRGMVPIMHGCNNFCTYCIVPHLRGREVSRSPNEIMAELSHQQSVGVKEITLLGQNVNSYQAESEGTRVEFPDLLWKIHRDLDLNWIRFLSSHPKDLSDRLIEAIREIPELCNHVHLPVQHGSDKVLSKMNRKYTRGKYLKLVEQMRARIPGVAISTDLMVGFPGEDDEDYQELISLVKEVRFIDAFTYQYNPMESTKAYDMDNQIPEPVKKERLSHLIDVQRKISREERIKRIGESVLVLVEGTSKKDSKELLGRMECTSSVVFPGTGSAKPGEFLMVRLLDLNGNTFRGETIQCQ